jgi:hypothetical protein
MQKHWQIRWNHTHAILHMYTLLPAACLPLCLLQACHCHQLYRGWTVSITVSTMLQVRPIVVLQLIHRSAVSVSAK